jgi:hypothetical protein
METAKTLLIAVLCLLAGYFFMSGRQKAELLETKLRALEEKTESSARECENRVALLKAERIPAPTARKAPPPIPKIREIVQALPNSPDKVEAKTIDDMKSALTLSPDQEKQIHRILEEFEQAKKKVYAKAMEEKRFPLDPQVLQGVNQARRDAMEKLKALLSQEQYRLLTEREYDLKLGLRVARPKT